MGDDQLALWRLNFPTTSDFGSVHDVPLLPIGFKGLFESYLIEAEGLVQHAVVGGEGHRCFCSADGPRAGMRGAS